MGMEAIACLRSARIAEQFTPLDSSSELE